MRKTPLRRKRELARGSAPMKTVNPKRRASEFARTYHSRERVRFVRALGCCWGGARGTAFLCDYANIDNAHTANDGKGRKGHYSTIVPLCRYHHLAFDEHRYPFNEQTARDFVERLAYRTEHMWRAHVAAGVP